MIKKHLLIKQKGIDSCSLLPQKWLVCLLTLLATFVGSGRMWADDDVVWTLDFKTASSSLTDSSIGATALGGNFTVNSTPCDFINFPDKIALPSTMGGQTGTTWRLAKNSGLRNGAGGERILGVNDCKAGQILTITHTATTINLSKVFNLKKIDESSTDTKTVFKVLNNGAVGFNVYKTETGVYPTIETMSLVTPDYTVTYSITNDPGEAAFSVINISNGNAVVASGSIVKAGDELKITAYEDDNGKYLKEWLVNGVSDKTNIPAPSVSIWHNKISFNRQIAENTDIQAVYAPCFTVDVQDLNGGTAVWKADGYTGNLNSGSGMREGSNVTVTLTPPSGKILNKWTLELKDGETVVYSNDNYSYANPLNLLMNYTQFASRTGEGYKFVLTPDYATGNIVTYELDGGTCAVTREITESSVTLPTPTKAGYSFIGWRTATEKIVPDAGVAGQTYTPTGNVTLYALWYKNNCEIDFTSNGPLAGKPAKADASISETEVFIAGGTSVGNITIDGYKIDSRFGVQTGTTWMLYNNGLYSFNSGNRAYGLNGCVEGEYIIINSSVNPNVNAADAELVSQVGNTYTYKVKKNGGVKFTPAKNSVLYSITVSSPCPHTIWYDTQVGPDDKSAGFWSHFSKFYKISKGETVNFKFITHGGNDHSWDNWLLIAQSINKHNKDLGVTISDAEKLVLRADAHCWGVSHKEDGDFNKFTNSSSYPNFINDMKDAEVELSVEFNNGGYLFVKAKATAKGAGDEYNGTVYEFTNQTNTFSETDLYLALSVEKAYLTGITHPIKFNDKTPSIMLTANGSAIYDQKAVGNPQGTNVVYTIVPRPGDIEAILTQEPGSNDYVLSVKGKGTVKVKASCGGQEDTYVLNVDGMFFEDPTPIIAHHDKKYDAQLVMNNYDDVNYVIVSHDTKIVDKDNNVLTPTLDYSAGGGKVTVNIPDNTEGGVVVVRATKGDAVAEFCLTVAYDLKVWDLYSDPLNYGTVVEGDKANSRPGSAHYVIYNAGNSYTYNKTVDGVDQSVTDGNRVAYNNWIDGVDLYAKEDFYKAQSGTKSQGSVSKDYNLLHRNWNFTYKTCTYKDGARTYVNEPLFAFNRTVVGDNARIIKETAGLRFEANPGSFGVSDNDLTNAEGASTSVREQDRCVLFRADQSKLIIPRVKCGRYIRIHWYRHSENSGDRCKITNGIDLDGTAINPDDVIRFTGSSYYYNEDEHLEEYRGSLVFKVAKPGDCRKDGDNDDCCDVVITPVINGWTEIYRIEVMDKFDSELQICEVDASKKVTAESKVGKQVIGEPYTTTDFWNARSLNNVEAYNRKVFDETKNTNPVNASRLVTKVRTRAQIEKDGNDVNSADAVKTVLPGGDAPQFYISGYAGHCFTWNGWMNTTLQAEFNGSAECKASTYNTQYGLPQDNTVAKKWVWVGRNQRYPMYLLENVKGEGTIKLTLRTHSGKRDEDVKAGEQYEPHYTFDKQEAYVAVGQYSVQEYPYTWDFTNYNFGKNNAYGGKTFDAMKDDAVNKVDTKEYGHWRENSANVWSMHAYQTKISGSMGGHLVKYDNKKLNKPYFAQGAQLALGTDASRHTILETEGLRVTIPALTTGSDLVKLVASDEATDTDRGYMTICSGGTITIPEVTAGMYVFVKGTAPKSASNTTTSGMVSFETNNDGKGNVTYYKATGGDVTLTFNTAATLYKIGVTDQVKQIAYYGYTTESRAIDIDYNETSYFSSPTSGMYLTDTSGWSNRNDANLINVDQDLQVNLTATEIQPNAYVPQGTGIILKNDQVTYEASQKDSNKSTSYTIPLFVPACNVPFDNSDNKNQNYLTASTDKDHASTTISTSLEGAGTQYYTMSNRCLKVDKKNNAYLSDYVYTNVPRFYRYVGSGGSVQTTTVTNKAFLKFTSSSVKAIGDFLRVDFDMGFDDEEATDIESVESDIIDNIADGLYYNLNGQVLGDKPSTKGIYIKNGKKYYVK